MKRPHQISRRHFLSQSSIAVGAPLAPLAQRAGKNVYCEKPLAITAREGSNPIETRNRIQ